jgi:hypothetical protein
LKHTLISLTDQTSVVEEAICNIFRNYIRELEQTPPLRDTKVDGIDEIHIINKPCCVMSNS